MINTLEYLRQTDFPALRRSNLETLQVNLGYLCNQQCLHCHVDAGPRRIEIMERDTINTVLDFIDKQEIRALDLTGGAPEMNPNFQYLVSEARARDVHVMDRCNLTILEEVGYEGFAQFLANNKVEVIASMPCYLEENVNKQRGKDVFLKSIAGLKQLNAVGYGVADNLTLNLVYNPQGPSLPPDQVGLELAYKKELSERYGVQFNQLFTLANMPIKRFGSTLLSKGCFEEYMQLLKTSYSDANLESVMCKTLISVDWKGDVYDCDFNQMLGLHAKLNNGKINLCDLMSFDFCNHGIIVMDHCFGCTAGQGSSCGGALT